MKKLALVVLALAGRAAAAPHPFTVDDLLRARRVGGWDVSPDGARVAYALTTVDVGENKTTSAIWLLDAAGARAITLGQKHDRDPIFSPDGKRLAFTSDRDGAPQVYLLDLDGGEPRALTKLAGGVDGASWSPDGKFLIVASDVFPDCADDACNRARAAKQEKPRSSGRVIERLLFRHWDAWRDGKRTHLFRVELDGAAKDLTPGPHDSPPFSLGGGRGWDVSPDGKWVAFASNHDRAEALSTNSDVWEVASTGGAAKCLTCENRAWDGEPRYSPDGRAIAYRAQRVPGAESDRYRLVVYDRASGKSRAITESFDAWVVGLAWAPDSRALYFTAPIEGRTPIFRVDAAGGPPAKLVSRLTAGDVIARGETIFFERSSLERPSELWRFDARGLQAVTHVNDRLFEEVALGDVRERWFLTKDGVRAQAWVVLPPGFDEHKRYPAILLVHGGPEGAWEDAWTYRWNAEVIASAGYVVYLPNPRGSVGYGQSFVVGIQRDWGGKVFDDLMRATDDLVSLPYVDRARVGAAGASFGGFMINWFEGHTDRFKALFCHDGISDQLSMYATEELWFPELEFGGPPWSTEDYRKWSPSESAAHFKTPEMIVHGERDYRVPVEQALLMYTLLERRGVPSRLLLFPDENHWVLKPANARLWYNELVDWFHHWLGGAPADPTALDTAYSITR